MPEGSHREREIFSGALERASAAERDAFLDGACANDPELRARIESLLRASDDAGSFLDERNASLPSGTADGTEATIREEPGRRIGRYKLLERIGEGGFGVVYIAEQEEPLRRRVALKIVKLGMDTRAVVARFEAERQALAMMDHPNIAKVFDGGTTDTGRPYFVMELVRGVPITTFCNEHRLSTRERLQLFVRVCHAVQHAHQKGVIHRDLKPSNILVPLHDDRPVPKVIDFGIAKATELRLTDKTLFTRFHHFIGTPSYMSPEQIGISGLDVDTRSDIYSLGVLLYELLTDRTPFDTEALLAAGWEAVHRVIREKEPPTPSQRLASLSGDEQTDVAQRRHLDGATLMSALRGDLDVIVMKCLEKNRARRYDTANGLAADLERHLNNEPVIARPPSASYRMAKFVRRNRMPVAFAGLILIALLGGLAGTLTQARRATRHAAGADEERRRADEAARVASDQRDFALRQLSRAEAINDLNAFLLSDAAPSGKRFTATELLARAEQIVDRQYADTDENRVEILIALGRQYQSQDEDAKARRLLTKAYELSRGLSDRATRAKATSAFAGAIARTGEFERAEKLIQESLSELGDEPQFALYRVFSLMRGSVVSREAGDTKRAIERIHAAEQILKGSAQGSALQQLRVSMEIAECYRTAGRHREAVAAFKDAFAQLKALGRDDTERAGTLLNNWALSVQSLGNPLEAERLFRQAIAIGSVDGGEQSVSPMLLNNMARVLLALHRRSEAADYADRAYEKAVRVGDEIIIGQCLNLRVTIYRESGELDRAEALLGELEPRWKRMMPPGHTAFTSAVSHRSMLALARGDTQRAMAEADRAIAMASSGSQALDYGPLLRFRRAEVEIALQRFEEAEADVKKALALLQAPVAPDSISNSVGYGYLLLGRVYVAQNKPDAARNAFTVALKHLEPTLGADHPETREAARAVGAP